MPTYNSITDRTEASALIPEQVATDLLKRATSESAALQMFKRIPVATNQTRLPVLSALPVAYWVTGDTGLKQTAELAWANKTLNIEEVAVIVPAPENVVEDLQASGFSFWDEVRPVIEEAVARTFDAAVFFGTNAPASFPTNISAAALAAGNTVTEGATAAAGGIQDDIDQVIGKVEADGFDVTGVIAARSLKGLLRRVRSTTGERLAGVNDALTEYMGLPIAYPARGLFPTGGAGANLRALVGDWTQFVVGVRKDITLKVLDQAVIQDGTGAIVYNLAQQDMVALRVTFRAGWQVANVINNDQPVEGSRYPAGRLVF